MNNEPPNTYSPAIHALRRQIARAWLSRMRSGALIELRPGGPRQLFLVHDGEGETLLYLSLARRMPDDLGVFAIEPRRLAGVPLAHASMEEMAAFYIEAVRTQQPQGPYLLGGLCAGGVIAYEMASQLVRAGESVELVALLEAALPEAAERPGRITEQRAGRLKQAIAEAQASKVTAVKRVIVVGWVVSRKVRNALLWEISQRCNRWWIRVRFRLLRKVLARERAWPKFVPSLSVRQIYDSIQARYTPRPLSISSVVVVRAQTGEGDDEPYRKIYVDETFGWNSVVHGVSVIDVDGGHSSMLQERFVDSLAKTLLPYLQQNIGPVSERPVETAKLVR